MGMTGPMPPHCEEFLIRTYSSHSCTSNRSCASPTRSRRRTGRSAPRRDDDCFGTDGRGTASAVDRRGRNRPRGPPVPARHPGTAGCGRPVGGLLSRRAARAERWVRRCRRILRHLRIRHHRAPAQRARDVGSDFTDRFLRATQPTHHSSRHGGHHRHRRADLREGRRCFRRPDRDRRPVDSGLPRQLPLRIYRHRLPHGTTAPLAAPEFLVPCCGRAVLSGLSDPLSSRGWDPDPLVDAGPAVHLPGDRHGRVVHPLGCANRFESHCRLLFPFHPRLGARHRRTDRRVDQVAARHSKGYCCVTDVGGTRAIAYGAVAFNSATAYPGYLVAIPVVGAALVISGGTRNPRFAAESVFARGPLQWIGKLSYSIYLWHWPLLVIAADAAGATSLPFRRNIIWLIVALIASVASFYLVENPLRHARLSMLGRWTPIGLGAVLIAASLIVATVYINVHAAPSSSTSPLTSGRNDAVTAVAGSTAEVSQIVREAATINKLPAGLTPALSAVSSSWGGPPSTCWPSVGQSSIPACMFGDPSGTHTMVVYGDSHAGMWFQALNSIAMQDHWRLAYLGKGWCPANSLPYQNPPGFGSKGGEYSACAPMAQVRAQPHQSTSSGSRDHHAGVLRQTRRHRLLVGPMATGPGQDHLPDSRTERQSCGTRKHSGSWPRAHPECLSRHSDDRPGVLEFLPVFLWPPR